MAREAVNDRRSGLRASNPTWARIGELADAAAAAKTLAEAASEEQTAVSELADAERELHLATTALATTSDTEASIATRLGEAKASAEAAAEQPRTTVAPTTRLSVSSTRRHRLPNNSLRRSDARRVEASLPG